MPSIPLSATKAARTLFLVLASGLITIGWPQLATAQYHIPIYTGVPSLITGGMLNQMTLNTQAQRTKSDKAGNEAERPSARPPISAVVSSNTILSPRTPEFPAKLAASYPTEQRQQAQRLFTDLLTGFTKIEDQFGLPRRDLAAAVAGFIAGSWMAYRDASFPDQHFKPLVEQVRDIISRDSRFLRATVAEKQETYEQLAILGMFMATNQMALQRRPDPAQQAKMQSAAKDYLEQFFSVDAERIQIGANGLELR